MASEVIDIAVAADEGYQCGLLVTAVSLARHASSEIDLRYNVLDGGLSDSTWNTLISQVANFHARSSFRRFKVTDNDLGSFPVWAGRGRMTYARLLLPDILTDSRYVIYCDVDFLWLADVGNLWRFRDERTFLITTRDGTEDTKLYESDWLSKRNLTFDETMYFCAGLCLFNLDLCRKYCLKNRLLTFLCQNQDAPYADQTALNVVLGGKALAPDTENVRLVDSRWQRLSCFVDKSDLNHEVVIHYAGDRPWTTWWGLQPLTDVELLWHREYGLITGLGVMGALKSFSPRWILAFRRLMFHIVMVPFLRDIVFRIYRSLGYSCHATWMRKYSSASLHGTGRTFN